MSDVDVFLRMLPSFDDPEPRNRVASYDVQDTQVNVLTTPTQLLGRNPRRVSWNVVNETAATIRLGPSPNVATATGVPLFGQGAAASADFWADRAAVWDQLFAFASVPGTVHVREVLILGAGGE